MKDGIFRKWLADFDKLPKSSNEVNEMLQKMEELATSFSDWRNIFYRSPACSIAEKTAILQMATKAKTFGEWLSVFYESDRVEETVREVALEQLKSLADNPADATWAKDKNALKISRWTTIYNISPVNSAQEATALNSIMQLMREEKKKRLVSAKDHSPRKL
jgi:hypothetical protein